MRVAAGLGKDGKLEEPPLLLLDVSNSTQRPLVSKPSLSPADASLLKRNFAAVCWSGTGTVYIVGGKGGAWRGPSALRRRQARAISWTC